MKEEINNADLKQVEVKSITIPEHEYLHLKSTLRRAANELKRTKEELIYKSARLTMFDDVMRLINTHKHIGHSEYLQPLEDYINSYLNSLEKKDHEAN